MNATPKTPGVDTIDATQTPLAVLAASLASKLRKAGFGTRYVGASSPARQAMLRASGAIDRAPDSVVLAYRTPESFYDNLSDAVATAIMAA